MSHEARDPKEIGVKCGSGTAGAMGVMEFRFTPLSPHQKKSFARSEEILHREFSSVNCGISLRHSEITKGNRTGGLDLLKLKADRWQYRN